MISQQTIDYAATVVKSELFTLFVQAKIQQFGEVIAQIPKGDDGALIKAHRELHYFIEFDRFINEMANDDQIAAYLKQQQNQHLNS